MGTDNPSFWSPTWIFEKIVVSVIFLKHLWKLIKRNSVIGWLSKSVEVRIDFEANWSTFMVLKPYSRATGTCSFSSFYEIGRISYCISFSIAALPKSVVHIFCFYYLICQTFAKSTEKTAISNPWGGGGVTPYIQMIGMIVVFWGVVIGDLVFLGVVQAKSFKKIKQVFVRV